MNFSLHNFYLNLVLVVVFILEYKLGDAQLQQIPETIRLGALFDGIHDQAEEAAFVHGVNMVNDDRSVLIRSRLIAVVDSKVPDTNSFIASRKFCEMLRPSGLAGVFGPSSSSTAGHIQSVADTLNIPHLETRWDYASERSTFSINIHPHPASLGKAYADLIAKLNWKSFIILYEDEESLVRLQEVIKLPTSFGGMQVKLQQLDPMTDDYRPLLKQIKFSTDFRIVLDCKFEKIEKILKQAHDVGIITDYYNYIITSLDLERLDLSPYKNSDVNITGFRIFNEQNAQQYLKKWSWKFGDGRGPNHPLYSKNILMYDAVRVFAKSMDDLAQMEGLRVESINCQQRRAWGHGKKLARFLSRIEYTGISGEIHFNDDGFRTDFELELIEKHRENMVKIGVWNLQTGVNYTRTQKEFDAQIVEKLQNKTFRITSTKNVPFVMERRDLKNTNEEELARMSFQLKYEGYCLDLVKALSKEVKFKYEFHQVADGSYGDTKSGEWNGMIRELMDQKADMAVIDLSITVERQTAVDFTMPFMHTGVGILFKKRSPPPPNLFSFLNPLSMDVWIYMTTAYLATSILMFLLARITPYEWDNPHPCKPDPEELETQFNLNNALWFGIGSLLCQGSDILPKLAPNEWEAPHPCTTDPDELENLLSLHNCFWHNWGSLMQQGSDIAPKAVSTRMVAGMWWFFTLIMISSYTANLAAFLTAAKMESPINSAEDLAKQTKIKYGTFCCGSTRTFFEKSPIYSKLNAVMQSTKPSVYANSNTDGISRVLREDGLYAFFMEAATIEYHLERKCELSQIGGLLDNKGYGIALPKDSPYTKKISDGILALQEKGVLQKLKNKWWKEKYVGDCSAKSEEGSDQLGLANLGGVFIVLLGGMMISVMIAVGEFVWKERIMIADPEQSMIDAMRTTIQFAIDLRAGDSKPIRDSRSMLGGSKSLLSGPMMNDRTEPSSLGPLGAQGGGGGMVPMDMEQVPPPSRKSTEAESPYATFNDFPPRVDRIERI